MGFSRYGGRITVGTVWRCTFVEYQSLASPRNIPTYNRVKTGAVDVSLNHTGHWETSSSSPSDAIRWSSLAHSASDHPAVMIIPSLRSGVVDLRGVSIWT